MANEPRHITEQAVRPEDLANMQKTDEDRRSEAAERAAEQFGDVTVSPDVYPEVSGDVAVVPRDESDNEPLHGQSARKMASAGEEPKAAKKTAAKATSSSGSSSSS